MSPSSNYPVWLRPPPVDVLLLNNSALSDVEILVNYLESVIMVVGDQKGEEKRSAEHNAYSKYFISDD